MVAVSWKRHITNDLIGGAIFYEQMVYVSGFSPAGRHHGSSS
jgi:hypothetical protein